MRIGRSSAIGILTTSIALGGCASGHPAPPSARQQAATGEIGPAFLQWTGTFKATLQATSTISGSSRNAVFGDVRLTAVDQNMMHARINFSVEESPPVSDNSLWSISSGECRSSSIPLLPPSEFPPIAIVNNRGTLDANVNLPLPTSGLYHVNVYWSYGASLGGADEGNVLACANLSLEHRSQDH